MGHCDLVLRDPLSYMFQMFPCSNTPDSWSLSGCCRAWWRPIRLNHVCWSRETSEKCWTVGPENRGWREKNRCSLCVIGFCFTVVEFQYVACKYASERLFQFVTAQRKQEAGVCYRNPLLIAQCASDDNNTGFNSAVWIWCTELKWLWIHY